MSYLSGRAPGDPFLRARDEKLESLKAVVGKLAHDFNNFLAPQYGYLTMLKDEAPAGSTVAMYINAMGAAAQKAEAYISTILLGMRPYRQYSPREFALDTLVDDMLAHWEKETPKAKEVRVTRDLKPALFCGDEKQWRVALEHILSNARFALAMGGELEVTLSRVQMDSREVERLGLHTDQVFCLRVRDGGFGMSPEVAARAFEPFFTTRTQIKAPGLGLTIVHAITLLHGGQVELETAEDKGTTLTLWLPTTPVRPNYNPGFTQAERRARKVLLIEDDPLIKEVLRGWIVRQNLEVESAATEAEARRSLERGGSDCLLVLCETDLQSGRGEDFYQRLAPAFPTPAWVFLSGQRAPQLVPPSSGQQPIVIKKPFSHNAFTDLIRKYTQI